MKVNFDDQEGGSGFTKGERYNLIVVEGKEMELGDKGTPAIKIILETETFEKAYDKTLFMTNKALYRAKEWFRALGLKDEGEVDFPTDYIKGIRLSAECDFKDGKYVEWINPLPISVGDQKPAAAPAAKAAPAAAQPVETEDVPF